MDFHPVEVTISNRDLDEEAALFLACTRLTGAEPSAKQTTCNDPARPLGRSSLQALHAESGYVWATKGSRLLLHR